MAHVAVEFWSGSGPPGKCLQTLSLQFSKSVDGYKLILSAWSPEASSARSQGKPKMAVRIAGGSEVCLNGCSSITELARIMGLAPFERVNVSAFSNFRLWGLSFGAMGLSSSALFRSIQSLIMCSAYMQGAMNSAISADESTTLDDSKSLLFVPDTPLSFGAMGL